MIALRPSRFAGLACLTVLVAGGCADRASEDAEVTDDAVVSTSDAPKLCAALRGNGHYIVTHFTSLARIVEHYGVVDGVAGGSSSTVSSFIYESILKNASVSRCGGALCSADARAARVSLALKSVEGYASTIADSEEVVAIRDLVGIAARMKREVDSRNVGALLSSDPPLAVQKLEEVLAIPEIRALVNPEIVAMLRDPEHLAFNAKEIHTSIATLGAFSVDDNRLFFRPGILSWSALSTLFGRVADFYAGRAERGALGAWLDVCAEGSVGATWEEIAGRALPTGGTCGSSFAKLVTDYRARARSASGLGGTSRLDDRVGDPSPLRKLMSTSVLAGAAVPAYEAARKTYLAGAHATGSIPFDVSWGDVKFGYWGADDDVAAALKDTAGFGDLKTRKATSLGNRTWREVLMASPAEPGLSRFVELSDGRISAGGWSDLAPVLVLKNMGCERVVYVTREGDESPFATKIAARLGMSEAEYDGLYSLARPTSGFAKSLASADAVWCTNWNSFRDLEQREMALDAWSAPLETRRGFAGIPTLRAYDNTTDRTGKVGCTVGSVGSATFPR